MSPIPLDARHIANQQGDFAPQLKSSWMIEIAGLEGDAKDLIVLSLESGALPAEGNEVVELKYGNEVRKVAGQAKFETMELVLKDFVDRGTRAAIVAWRKKVYDAEGGLVGLPSAYKKEATMILLATDNTHLRKCRLIGVWPSDVKGGDLSMAESGNVHISITLQYDRAIWQI